MKEYKYLTREEVLQFPAIEKEMKDYIRQRPAGDKCCINLDITRPLIQISEIYNELITGQDTIYQRTFIMESLLNTPLFRYILQMTQHRTIQQTAIIKTIQDNINNNMNRGYTQSKKDLLNFRNQLINRYVKRYYYMYKTPEERKNDIEINLGRLNTHETETERQATYYQLLLLQRLDREVDKDQIIEILKAEYKDADKEDKNIEEFLNEIFVDPSLDTELKKVIKANYGHISSDEIFDLISNAKVTALVNWDGNTDSYRNMAISIAKTTANETRRKQNKEVELELTDNDDDINLHERKIYGQAMNNQLNAQQITGFEEELVERLDKMEEDYKEGLAELKEILDAYQPRQVRNACYMILKTFRALDDEQELEEIEEDIQRGQSLENITRIVEVNGSKIKKKLGQEISQLYSNYFVDEAGSVEEKGKKTFLEYVSFKFDSLKDYESMSEKNILEQFQQYF